MRTESARPEQIDGAEPSPYLRRSRKVEVRRSAGRWRRALVWGGAVLALGGLVATTTAWTVYLYLTSAPRFTLAGPVSIGGAAYVERQKLAEVFARDAGRSVFAVSLEQRQRSLLALPWVKTAHLMRGWPNRLRVDIAERTPVAFVRLAAGPESATARLALIDADGVLLPLPRNGRFSLPVLIGIREQQSPAERRERVALLLDVLRDLDREAPARSGEISEINLSDPTNAAVTVAAAGAAVQVHLGNRNFLDRYKLFLHNIEAWRDQYGAVHSVDLRFEKQVVVK